MKRSLAILLFLAAAPAPAQDSNPDLLYKPGETYNEWIDRVVTEGTRSVETAADQSANVAAQRVADKAVPEGSPETQGSLRDFLPLFFGSLGLGGVKDQDGALTLTFNPELFNLGPANPLSVQAVVRDPVVFDAMLKAIPENIRADRKSTFEEQVQDFDDVELNLSWTRESERWGRDPKNHDALMESLFSKMLQGTPRTATREFLAFIGGEGLPNELLSKRPDEIEESVRLQLEPRIMAAVEEIIKRQRMMVQAMEEQQWFQLDDLINNQPQLLASAVYRRRDDLTGPDGWSVKASFELGFANINGLRRFCSREKKSVVESDCLPDYLKKMGGTTDIAPRLKIEGEFSEEDPYDFALSGDDFTFHLDRVRKTVGRATLGGYLRSNAQGNQTTRFDLEAMFEDVTGDEKRNNRFVTTLSFTQKLTGDMSAMLSAVYANKPEYRGEVDEELSARLGLRYKIDRKQP